MLDYKTLSTKTLAYVKANPEKVALGCLYSIAGMAVQLGMYYAFIRSSYTREMLAYMSSVYATLFILGGIAVMRKAIQKRKLKEAAIA